jgi:hypothetical protein
VALRAFADALLATPREIRSGELVGEPVVGRARRRLAAHGGGMRGAVVGAHRQGRVQRVGGAGDVEGVHHHRHVTELAGDARLARQHEHAVALVDDRALLGDEVQPVSHGVHEQHVVAAQRGDRAREVITGVVEDRRPRGRAPLLVDATDDALDLLPVGEVLGQALARRVHERAEDDALAPLGIGAQQVVVGEEAPHDVLRELDAVDAHEQLAIAHLRLELAQSVGARVGRRDLLHVVGVGGRGCHEGVGVHTDQLAARQLEGVGPPMVVEPARRCRQAGEELAGDIGGEDAHRVGPRERRVVEVHDAHVVAQLAQGTGHQRQVVVLHEDDRAVRRVVGDGACVRLVHPAIRVPRLTPRAIEARSTRGVEQAVVQEPQRRVRDHVVVRGEVLDDDLVDAVALGLDHAARCRLAIAVGERGGDPRRIAALERTTDDGDEPAGSPLRLQVAVSAELERDRPAIRREHHGGGHGVHRTHARRASMTG